MHLKDLYIDREWTLFLDRDGVINERLEDDYVKNTSEFRFLERVPEAIASLFGIFGRILVVTNQQGIGKGLMTEEDLRIIHDHMVDGIVKAGGYIHKIYHCSSLERDEDPMRKPNTGMALKAQQDFPEIDFKKSIIVGDSMHDMEFGKRLGMIRVFILPDGEKVAGEHFDFRFPSLTAFAARLA